MVAIVGMCGSGKTTSVSLLERFYGPDEGRILVGDGSPEKLLETCPTYRMMVENASKEAEI